MLNYSYPRISEEEYRKSVGLYRLNLAIILKPLRMYGQGHVVDGAIESIVDLTEQFGMRVRGKEQPYVMPKNVRIDVDNPDD